MTEQTPLDSILSRDSAPASSPDPTPTPETPTEPRAETKAEEQLRLQGKFATKEQVEAAKAPQAPVEQPAEPPSAVQPQPAQPGSVPQPALHAAREKVREKDTEIAELRGQIAQLTAMVQQTRAPQPPPAPPTPPPDPYADPEGYAQHVAREMVSPIEQRVEQQQDFMSRRLAEMEHKPEVVQAALAAMYAADQSNDASALAELQRIKRSQHPYGELVAWHKQRSALTEIGTDPEAYKARIRAEIMAEMQANGGAAPPAQQQPAQPAPVMPSNLAAARNVGNRTGPAWSGPTSIQDIFDRRKKAG